MKRASKLKSNAYAPVSTNLVGQNMVYMHMSSHYRRLMNVKSHVDSSLPPRRCRVPRTLPTESSRRLLGESLEKPDLDLADTIAFDSVNGPDAYYRDSRSKFCPSSIRSTSNVRSQTKKRHSQPLQAQCGSKSATKRPSRPPADLLEHHSESFEQRGCEFNPRLLKSEAESRVRTLNVYHPPRRRKHTTPRQDWPASTPLPVTIHEVSDKTSSESEDDQWLLEHTPGDQMSEKACNQCGHTKPRDSSKVSTGSRDSAYNGGTSSGADSRGPTPEQVPLVKPAVVRHTSVASKHETTNYTPRKEDTLYATFSHHITEDILLRGIFSDRGMDAVFQRHVEENRLILDTDRMQEEIGYLRVQLGMSNDGDRLSRKPSGDDTKINTSVSSYVTKSNPNIYCSVSNNIFNPMRPSVHMSSSNESEILSSSEKTISTAVKTDVRFSEEISKPIKEPRFSYIKQTQVKCSTDCPLNLSFETRKDQILTNGDNSTPSTSLLHQTDNLRLKSSFDGERRLNESSEDVAVSSSLEIDNTNFSSAKCSAMKSALTARKLRDVECIVRPLICPNAQDHVNASIRHKSLEQHLYGVMSLRNMIYQVPFQSKTVVFSQTSDALDPSLSSETNSLQSLDSTEDFINNFDMSNVEECKHYNPESYLSATTSRQNIVGSHSVEERLTNESTVSGMIFYITSEIGHDWQAEINATSVYREWARRRINASDHQNNVNKTEIRQATSMTSISSNSEGSSSSSGSSSGSGSSSSGSSSR